MFRSNAALDLEAFDLPPESWTTESWKILILTSLAGRRVFHEEVAVQRATDRLYLEAG
jgi:hypothetical protein